MTSSQEASRREFFGKGMDLLAYRLFSFAHVLLSVIATPLSHGNDYRKDW